MIKLSNLHKKFDSRGIAGVNGVSLELKEGEICALMGPNGGGKTTLLNMIAGKIPAEGGEIKLEGKVAVFEPHHYPTCGNVQKFLVNSVTVTDDVEKKIQLARDLADLMEFTFQLRQDLSQLSAGQKQKIQLSALLINRPQVVLFDEPFTHLDPMTRKGILTALFQYLRNQQISAFWVTHDLDEALLFSDHIGILNFGKLEQWGTPEEIIFRPANLFVAQFLGYKNIIPIKFENGSWLTPFGLWKSPNPHGWEEALMIIPEESWNFAGELAKKFKIISSRVSLKYWEVQADFEGRLYTFHLSHSHAESLKTGSIHALPLWEEAFIIKL